MEPFLLLKSHWVANEERERSGADFLLGWRSYIVLCLLRWNLDSPGIGAASAQHWWPQATLGAPWNCNTPKTAAGSQGWCSQASYTSCKGHIMQIAGNGNERESGFLLPLIFQSCCSAGRWASSLPGSTARLHGARSRAPCCPSQSATVGCCALAHMVWSTWGPWTVLLPVWYCFEVVKSDEN